ncbi:MAG TPA: hypothetical protein VFI95_17735 [Terriglobales bacterium]|nr:hypothetical protein [Terriglobales bacterium]
MGRARISELRELRLNHKQRLYVEGVAAGKSRRRAALEAGYSLSSANNPSHNIERGRVREVFAQLIRSTVPPELIVQRIREGLDAAEIKVFQHEGGVVYSKPLVNWSERRDYLELAARYGGYYVDRHELELADDADPLPLERLKEKTRELLLALEETP